MVQLSEVALGCEVCELGNANVVDWCFLGFARGRIAAVPKWKAGLVDGLCHSQGWCAGYCRVVACWFVLG